MHAVGRQLGVELADHPGGLLGVDAVHQRLVRLPAEDEPDRVVVRPVPGLLLRVRAVERRGQTGRPLVVGAQQVVVRLRAGRVDLLRPLGPGRQHLGPPPLHRGEVPQQVGGVPVGTGRDPGRRVAVGEHVAEASGLGAQVVEVDVGGQAGVE